MSLIAFGTWLIGKILNGYHIWTFFVVLVSFNSWFSYISTDITTSSKHRRRAVEKVPPGETSPNQAEEQETIEGKGASDNDDIFFDDVDEPLFLQRADPV